VQSANNQLTCSRCKLPIEAPAYMRVNASIILQKKFDRQPPLYACKEVAENMAMAINLHDHCWIATLEDHGVVLHDIKKILTDMQHKHKGG